MYPYRVHYISQKEGRGKEMNVLLELFLGFVRIGAMAFGGAYASIPLVQREVVDVNGWLTYEEFGNLLALDELTPGPILINSATFVGASVAGVLGAVVASLGSILPACIITMILLWFFRKYRKLEIITEVIFAIKCMTVGLISVTILRAISNALLVSGSALGLDPVMVFLTASAFLIIRKWQTNPLLAMLGCGLIYSLFSLIIL